MYFLSFLILINYLAAARLTNWGRKKWYINNWNAVNIYGQIGTSVVRII